MRALRLSLVALWFRRWLSVAVLAVAVVTTTAASLGPFFARAAGESVLRDTLASAPVQRSGVELSQTGPLSQVTPQSLVASLANSRPLTSFGTRVSTSELSTALLRHGDSSGRTVLASFAARDGICDHLHLIAGSCPADTGEVMVSNRTARTRGWQVGQHLDGTAMNSDPMGAPVAVPALTISAIYQVDNPAQSYWFGQNFFGAHPAPGTPGNDIDTIDTVFTTPATIGQVAGDAKASALVDLPLLLGPVHTAGLPRLRADLATIQRASEAAAVGGAAPGMPAYAGPSGIIAVTGLPGLLGEVSRNQSLLDIAVLAITLQLAVLAWFVLYLLIATTTEARATEVALAKLHGLPPLATLAFGLLEPVLLIVVATPLGLLVGDIVTQVMAHTFLASGTAVELRWPPVYGALGALAGGLVAAVLAGRRALSRPVLAQWERSGGDRASRRAGTVVDGLVAALAVAGIVQLVIGGTHRGGSSDVVALVAPAMLTLALALLAVRLVPLACLPILHRTRASDRVPTFLAYRQLVRRPSVLRLVTLLALATALATFAVDASAIASRNRGQRAAYDVGADRVLDVSAPSPQQLMTTVRTLDPGGTEAMAVLANTPFSDQGDRTGTLLAVDSSRLGAVANWRHDLADESAGSLGSALHPAVPAPIRVHPGALRVGIDTSALTASVPVTVTADIAGAVGATTNNPGTVSLGTLRRGLAVYIGTVPACPDGCRLTGLELAQPLGSFATITGTVAITSVAGTSGPYDSRLTTTGVWSAKPAGTGASQATTTAAGLSYAFSNSSGDPPGVLVRDVPDALPVIFGATSAGSKPPTQIRGLDGSAVPADPVAVAAGVPGAGPSATVVDLEYALRAGGDQPTGDLQVWLAASAPGDFAARLQRAGIDVLAAHTTAQRRTELDRSGPALALLLFLIVAVAATVIAAGATAVTIYLGARRRTFEVAAMLAVGVRRAQLFRAATREHLLLLVTGVGVGLLGGLVGATLAMPTVPEFTDGSAVPRLLLAPVAWPLLALLAVVLVAAGLTVMLAARLVVRAARPARLREAAP